MAWATSAAFLLACLYTDLRWRRVPNVLIVGSFVGLVIGWAANWWELSPLGALAALALSLIARYPGGDVKAVAVLGLVLGPILIAEILVLALLLTLYAWRRDPRERPWMVSVGVSYGVIFFLTILLQRF